MQRGDGRRQACIGRDLHRDVLLRRIPPPLLPKLSTAYMSFPGDALLLSYLYLAERFAVNSQVELGTPLAAPKTDVFEFDKLLCDMSSAASNRGGARRALQLYIYTARPAPRHNWGFGGAIV